MRYLYCRGYVEMPMKKKALSITLCIITLLPLLVSLVITPVTSADPTTGRTTLYFKDVFSEIDMDFDFSGTFQQLTLIPPTKQEASAYPPLIRSGVSLSNLFPPDIDFIMENLDDFEFGKWLLSWGVVLLWDDILAEFLGEFDEEIPSEFKEIVELIKFSFPHPLRIIQGYEHTGDEPIQLNGNIDYTLYFRTKFPTRLQKNDEVKLTIYRYNPASAFPIPTKIANTTFSLTANHLQKTVQQTISITDVSQTIHPDQMVLFSIELIPGNKTLSSLVLNEYPRMRNLAFTIYNFLLDNLETDALQNFSILINEFESILEDFDIDIDDLNLTREDAAYVIKSLISFSFLYDSSDYPSSVTVPFRAVGDTKKDSITYYLRNNNVLDTNRPVAEAQQRVNLIDTVGSWTGQTLSRNKIISDASAIIFINHKDLQPLTSNMEVEAALTYGDVILSTDSVTLDRTTPFSTTERAYRFTFEDVATGVELTYGQNIGLRLSLKNTTNIRSLLRTAEVLFDADAHASMLSFILSETDNIKVTSQRSPASGKIIVGDTVSYTLDVTSTLADDILIRIKEEEFSSAEDDFWDVQIFPASFSIESNANKTVSVILTSLGTTLQAYEEKPLNLILEVIGNTGYDTVQLTAEVSSDAVTFDTLIDKPEEREVKRGITETFKVTIENNNTGLWRDSFRFYADIDKNLSINVDPEEFDNLDAGSKTSFNVSVTIPRKTAIREATITVTIASKRSGISHTIPINFTIIGPGVLESTYDFFDEMAGSMGLKEIFNENAALVLVSIIFIVIFFILIIMVFILTINYVDVTCSDAIKEIFPGNKATYEVTLKNTTNKQHTYRIRTDKKSDSSSWTFELPFNQVTIPAKQEKTIPVTIHSTDESELGEWIDFRLIIETEGKTKKESIPLFCSLTDGTVSLSIKDVFHWPKAFSNGEKVSTSVRVNNNGNIKAKGISVKLFINNKEKNKVQELIIPAGGYADITLPWIAEKGKNDLRLLVC